MPLWLLKADIISGPLPWIVWAVSAVLVATLVIRRPRRRWVVRAGVGVLAGGVLGVVAILVLVANGTVAHPGRTLFLWAGGGLAALGLAIATLWDSPGWRKGIAIAALPCVLLAATLGINARFGIDRTVGDFLGVSTLQKADGLKGPAPLATAGQKPLYETWKPPADMPAVGKVSALTDDAAIPSTGGFKPRDASIYLPPAALVDDPPPLPLVVHMMGQPGDPNPQFIQGAMDKLAAENNGLAPIVIVADQLGDVNQNPACMDSAAYGGVATYFNVDIPAYAAAKLRIIPDHRYWTISGYSNGGACAFAWGAEHPDIWGNLVSISGEEFQGSEEQDAILNTVFNGDQAAYDAAKPASIAAANRGKYAGHPAIFTAGELDPAYVAAAKSSAMTAQDAGFDTSLFVIPGADHVVTALEGGLPTAYRTLFPHLGLAPPAR